MASRSELEAAFRAAHAAGDVAAATRLAAALAAFPVGGAKSEARQYAEEQTAAADAKTRAEGGLSGNFLTDMAAGSGKWLDDKALAAEQYVNSVATGITPGIGNREDLARRAKEKHEQDSALEKSVAGRTGIMLADMAATALPFGVLARAAMVPKALGRTRQILTGMLPAATIGAAEGMGTPSENYDASKQALWGGTLGAAVDRKSVV